MRMNIIILYLFFYQDLVVNTYNNQTAASDSYVMLLYKCIVYDHNLR